MIDLRYHIVSIMGVFLALGLGILLGSSVVSDPLSAQLNQDLTDARSERDAMRQERNEALTERDELRARAVDEIAPWVMDARLDGRRFILVADGTDEALQRHVQATLVDAGAEPFGRLVFEDRLAFPDATDRDALSDAVTSIIPACTEDESLDDCFDTSSEDLASEALSVVGRRFGDAVGQVVLDGLIDGGFLSAPGRPDADWPSSDAIVVMLASGRSDEASAAPGALAFARAISARQSLLVASATPDRESLVTDLREADDLSDQLSTFDSANDSDDPGGIGVFAALVAATEGRGGHFGKASKPFVAPAPGPE